jgi:hypothetical protein
MKRKMLLLTIAFVVIAMTLLNSCSKNKSSEKGGGNSVVAIELSKETEAELKRVISYGFIKAIMYQDCLTSLNKNERVEGQYTFNVMQVKDGAEEFDNTIYLMCEEIKGLNFIVRTKGKLFYYAGCASDDDVKTISSGNLSAIKYEDLKVQLTNFTKDKIRTYVSVSGSVREIENIKRQIKVIFEDEDFTKNQNFYVGPFSDFDLSIRLYWVEKKSFIDLSRAVFDMELKNIAAPQLVVRSFSDKSQVDAMVKYGDLITVAKSK